MPLNSPENSNRFSKEAQELQDRVQAERAEYSRREPNNYPQRVRHETRWQTYELVINIAPNFWDRYGGMHFNNSYLEKAKELRDSLLSPAAKKVLAIDKEPWTTPAALSEEGKMYFEKIKGFKKPKIAEIEEEVKDLRKPLLTEIERAYQEYELITGKIVPLWFAMKGWASSQDVSQDYMKTPVYYLLLPRDYVLLGNLPARIYEQKELGVRPVEKGKPPKEWESFYTEEEFNATLKELGLEENVPLGIGIDRVIRIKYLQSLSFTPDKIVDWMAKAKKKEYERIKARTGAEIEAEIEKDFKEGKLIKRKDSDGVDLFPAGHPIYLDREKYGEAWKPVYRMKCNQEIENAWWKQFGFKDAAEGKNIIGDPLTWIPLLARRGKETTDYSLASIKPQRRIEIQREIENLKRIREELTSPLISKARRNELTNNTDGLLKQSTDRLRDLMTVTVKRKRKTLFEALSLENQLGLRKPLTSLGVIEAKPQRAGPKSQVVDTELYKFAKGDQQAAELGKMIHTLWGFGSKYGFYARDFDPETFKEKGFFDINSPAFSVDVEGWPYSEELAKWMAFVYYQMYKREASGPEGSRGRFGPLSSDFLSHAIYKEHKNSENPETDEVFKIIDENGVERPGLPEEGMVIGDTSKSLLDFFEEGTLIGELPLLQLEESEDLSRRWLLRNWFGGGREEDSLMRILVDKNPDPKDLVTARFRDALKLDVKVTMKPYLFKEMVWRDIIKEIDNRFENDIAWLKEQLNQAHTPEDRKLIFQKYGHEQEGEEKHLTYDEWQSQRKEKIDDYIMAWWWEGVMSTSEFEVWAHEPVKYGEQQVDVLAKGPTPEEKRVYWEEIIRNFWEGGVNLRLPTKDITGNKKYGILESEVYARLERLHKELEEKGVLKEGIQTGRPKEIDIEIDPNP